MTLIKHLFCCFVLSQAWQASTVALPRPPLTVPLHSVGVHLEVVGQLLLGGGVKTVTASAARRLIRWVPRHPVDHAELGEEPEPRALTPAGEPFFALLFKMN